MNMLGLDLEMVEEHKYLRVHLNNNMDWTRNKKGQSQKEEESQQTSWKVWLCLGLTP